MSIRQHIGLMESLNAYIPFMTTLKEQLFLSEWLRLLFSSCTLPENTVY
jgi:hypothetical protein